MDEGFEINSVDESEEKEQVEEQSKEKEQYEEQSKKKEQVEEKKEKKQVETEFDLEDFMNNHDETKKSQKKRKNKKNNNNSINQYEHNTKLIKELNEKILLLSKSDDNTNNSVQISKAYRQIYKNLCMKYNEPEDKENPQGHLIIMLNDENLKIRHQHEVDVKKMSAIVYENAIKTKKLKVKNETHLANLKQKNSLVEGTAKLSSNLQLQNDKLKKDIIFLEKECKRLKEVVVDVRHAFYAVERACDAIGPLEKLKKNIKELGSNFN